MKNNVVNVAALVGAGLGAAALAAKINPVKDDGENKYAFQLIDLGIRKLGVTKMKVLKEARFNTGVIPSAEEMTLTYVNEDQIVNPVVGIVYELDKNASKKEAEASVETVALDVPGSILRQLSKSELELNTNQAKEDPEPEPKNLVVRDYFMTNVAGSPMSYLFNLM